LSHGCELTPWFFFPQEVRRLTADLDDAHARAHPPTSATATVTFMGDANMLLGDANMMLGDAMLLGDANMMLGDANMMLGDAMLLGDANMMLGDV
jgi:hypothetical protein